MINKIVIFLFLSCILFGCINVNHENINIKNKKYKSIFIYNEADTLKGFYNVQNDSLFYISLRDYSNNNNLVCDNNLLKKSLDGYFLFSLNIKKPYSSEKHKCDINPMDIDFDLQDLRNIFYPPKLIKDSLYLFKQVSVIYDSDNPTIREFIISKDLKIKSFKTINKIDENYFFYD